MSKSKKVIEFPPEIIEPCLIKLQKYKAYKRESLKAKIRNELFDQMYEILIIWIRGILCKWGKYKDRNQLLSISWDAFMFSLKYYKGIDDLSKHFYTHTRYYLFIYLAKKEEGIRIPFMELKMILNEFPTPQNQHFERLMTLYQFREVVPDKFKPIWDDAMNGVYQDNCILKSKEMDMLPTTFKSIRDVFRPIIKLILGMPQEEKTNGKKCKKTKE